MKLLRFLILCGIIVFTTSNVMAQGPLRIPYQAVLRSTDGAILSNQPVIVKASVIIGEPSGDAVFSEIHSVVSNRTGVISLAIGRGQSLLGTIEQINWKSGLAYLKIEIDYENSGSYILIGISQILSVPFAIQSGNSLDQLDAGEGQIISHDGTVWLPNNKVWVKSTGVVIDGSETHDPLSSIFSIKNANGEPLFKINEQGVKVLLNDLDENRGVLEVKGRTSQNQYLVLSPDSAKVQFNIDGVKAEKGGFAIGGLSNGKSVGKPFFMLEPSATQFNFDKWAAIKSEKGGFAIGGLSNGKVYSDLLTINPDSTRMYMDTIMGKAEKGGFAIGGLSNGKIISENFFRMSNVGAQLKFDETAGRAEKGGFAIGGLSNGKTASHDYLALSELKTRISMVEIDEKQGIGGLAIG